ncbi:DNA helicase [Sphaerisporangium krabiense]|uniref:DNA helicase IV n=1 Tax=Sphaerisporangium krabiense TaxID=763782 RepID=A0A7W9DP82_9ACTN|nr:ATP-binding domain-containing protein [Sphaerisporangium krabiense]MBB5625779.1 DNA helicase IV [Sphaerisporangium krabiense]GII62885.1 DNA helicase [Sphaerisporangium krabiense]
MTSQDPEHPDQIAHEQAYVTRLYRRLDALRAQTRARLAEVSHDAGGTAQARTERDVAFGEHTRRLARLDAAENRLCFGRLDLGGGERRYIGRIGLWPESGDGDPLLVDWRAPAARPFYVATPAAPRDVRRRRHILTRGRRVVSVDDETLGEDGDTGTLAGEAALLAALNAGRTGRMPDIVATLRAEQDAVIRSDHRGVLVVQGGPGTGKTAVALHRAAYLLYERPRLASQGVLVIGPNPTFLRYIGQVLPGLGETGVLSATVAELFPGVRADRAEPAATAEVKGRAVMAEVLAAAVRARQAPPGAEVRVEFGDETLVLEPEVVARAAARARDSRLPHNQARPRFAATLVGHLARRVAEQTRELAERIEADVAGILAEADVDRAVRADLAALGLPEETPPQEIGGEDDVRDLRRALASDPAVREALDALWPALTPRGLLEDLFSDPRGLAAAAPGLDEAERASLVRAPGGWSTADVPLLDEAAELLGVDDRARRARAARDRARRDAYAQGVLDIAAADEGDGEVLTAGDLLDARRLAERHERSGDATVAERAAVDRTWTFGHVIVDEAQELSAMAWRMVMRRCPGRSMTLVGDLAQTSDAAGATSWDEVLRPYAGDRWRLARLSVNYRTPAEIMDAAAGLVADLGPEAAPPRSVRRTGVPPWRANARDLPASLARHAAREAAAPRGGRLAVIVPDGRLGELAAAVRAAVPGTAFGPDPDLTAPVVVLGVGQAKGLEFDAVLIADPAAILAAAPRGRSDLYVAMTRATQRLGILHPGPPPAEIAGAVPELREGPGGGS